MCGVTRNVDGRPTNSSSAVARTGLCPIHLIFMSSTWARSVHSISCRANGPKHKYEGTIHHLKPKEKKGSILAQVSNLAELYKGKMTSTLSSIFIKAPSAV